MSWNEEVMRGHAGAKLRVSRGGGAGGVTRMACTLSAGADAPPPPSQTMNIEQGSLP